MVLRLIEVTSESSLDNVTFRSKSCQSDPSSGAVPISTVHIREIDVPSMTGPVNIGTLAIVTLVNGTTKTEPKINSIMSVIYYV